MFLNIQTAQALYKSLKAISCCALSNLLTHFALLSFVPSWSISSSFLLLFRCGHCKSLAPEYAKAAKALEASPAKLAKLDATAHTKASGEFGIKGFPTLKWFRNGKASDYTGGRTEAEIVSWVNKKSGPAFHTLGSEDELTKFQEAHDVFTVGVFDSEDSDAAKAFKNLANEDELHVFALSTSDAVKNKLAVEHNTVVVLKSFDDLRADMSVAAGFDSEAVGEFVMGNSMPLIQEFSAETSKQIFGSPITKHALFFTDKKASHHKDVMDSFSTVASAHKGKVLFVNVPSTENKVLEFFGLTAADVPRAVFADLNPAGGQMKKYMYDGELNSASVTDYVAKFLDGKLKATLKSETPDASDTAGNVKVLKGSSFNEIVMDNNKDVMVEFYAPWCGHCKKLAPIWDELGDKFADNDNVVIAKMDSTANEIDVDGVAVKGFPTLFFFKGDDKAHPVAYSGARELDDLEEYIKTNGHHKASHSEL